MAYLRLKDYYTFIQSDNLQQVIRGDDSLRLQAEKGAEATITEALVQKYDLAEEFTDTLGYSFIKTYQAGQLIDLNFTAYSAALTYAINDTVLNAGLSYICTTTIGTPEVFNVSKWKLLGSQYDLFNIPYPYPLFNYENNYNVGDLIYHKGKIYKCLISSTQLSHGQQLQYSTYQNLPYSNVFPDNATYGAAHWGVGVSYSVVGLLPNAVPTDFTDYSSVTSYVVGNKVKYNSIIYQAIKNSLNITPETDITAWQPISWVSGDNRNPNILEHYIDCTLYKLHKGIAPRNIPDLRVKAYDDAINWLEKCADGRITLNLPKLQPLKGNKIRFNGNIKNINSY